MAHNAGNSTPASTPVAILPPKKLSSSAPSLTVEDPVHLNTYILFTTNANSTAQNHDRMLLTARSMPTNTNAA